MKQASGIMPNSVVSLNTFLLKPLPFMSCCQRLPPVKYLPIAYPMALFGLSENMKNVP